MIRIFEGPRNSGKTFLARKYASKANLSIFKFDFVGWFNRLSLPDDNEITHSFALGKELMLLQLNRDGLLPDFILDRGILTVLTWGILSGRITEEEAKDQVEMIANQGLLNDCEIFYVIGKNPDVGNREKDNWDFRDGDDREAKIMENLRGIIANQPYNVPIKYVTNNFDEKSVEALINMD
jgi:hypothetical protein